MKITSLTSVSLIVGAVAAVAAGLACIAAGDAVWWVAVTAAALFFVLCYGVTYLIVRKFVIYKLKPLYQMVLSKDVKTSEIEGHLTHTDHVVEEIEGEITVWAEKNKREIARLKENEKYRKEYIGNVSHELKTPIFNIQGYILTLLDGGLEDPSINRAYLERTEKSIDRLINIITDLEQISKLESGVLKLNMERVDLVSLVRDAVEIVEMEAVRKHIKITLENLSGSMPLPIHVKGDKHYISQVFINLLTNSIKYGNEDGQTRVSFIDLFDKVMVEVSDDGVGISKDDIPRVFERFYRTDKSRSREQGGTGLGLSIVKHILEAHNESITLRSHPGKGSTFSFTLTKS